MRDNLRKGENYQRFHDFLYIENWEEALNTLEGNPEIDVSWEDYLTLKKH
jgi:hypothetical protein